MDTKSGEEKLQEATSTVIFIRIRSNNKTIIISSGMMLGFFTDANYEAFNSPRKLNPYISALSIVGWIKQASSHAVKSALYVKSTLVPCASNRRRLLRESLHQSSLIVTAVEQSRHRCLPLPQSVTGNFILNPLTRGAIILHF
ncbi:uncharacterized protein G2W53_036755 [Senna tora]|uniref:Uncharacterized protein n=1 Tax=Senna tora TaxID=362788 RepID=A0A834SUK4_9FABA|nr:uncharacterized protein G2W53_036755 [Senna tora]